MAAPNSKQPPAKTPQAREYQLANLALDLAEKQLIAGTATSQLQVHFLKTITMRDQLERVKIEHEIELLRAKNKQIDEGASNEDLHNRVLRALSDYRGMEEEDDSDY